MPELIQQKKYELNERTARIIALAQETAKEIEEVERYQRRTVFQGLQLGALLLEEQDWVNDKLGKGSWASYFDITFSNVISFSMAGKWMKQARDQAPHISTVSSPTIANKDVTLQETPKLDDNQYRAGLSILGLVPSKKHQPKPEAGPTIATPKLSTHLGLINRLMAWHAELMTSNDGFLPQEHRSQLIKDFAPVLAFINEMRG